jgi:hypothetical protein
MIKFYDDTQMTPGETPPPSALLNLPTLSKLEPQGYTEHSS